jgi:phosphoglycerate kinase
MMAQNTLSPEIKATFAKHSLSDLKSSDLKGKRVFVRVDFNVPMASGAILNDARIKAALPTIKFLSDAGAKIILASHLGEPKGQVVENLRLAPISKRLAKLSGLHVFQAKHCTGPDVDELVKNLKNGEIVLLENIRFDPGESKNSPEFSKKLASLADLYVNDAFGTAHRSHASVAGIAQYLPAYAGFLLKKEADMLNHVMDEPARPLVAIIGGSKVSGKIGVLESLLDHVDCLVIGGGMAFTFLKAQGFETGKSIVENDKLDIARHFLQRAATSKTRVVLPVDQVVVPRFENNAPKKVVPIAQIPFDMMGVDVGPETIAKIKECIRDARTVVWNGPLGVFEMDNFAAGTFAVAQALAASKATTIIGGGDSGAAIEKAGLADKMTHISTGGGASIEFLAGSTLPGLVALMDKPSDD